MAAIDHIVLVSPDLAAGIQHLASLSGVTAEPGGAHPRRGTHNALAAFDDDTYLELIGIDPDQPEPDSRRPFGLTADAAMRLATFAVHATGTETLDDLVETLLAAGYDPGPVVPMSRIRPDGVELRWRLTLPGQPVADGGVPFAIDWGDTPNPAASLPALGELVELRIAHPSADVCSIVETLDPRIRAEIGIPHLAADVATAEGTVTLA